MVKGGVWRGGANWSGRTCELPGRFTFVFHLIHHKLCCFSSCFVYRPNFFSQWCVFFVSECVDGELPQAFLCFSAPRQNVTPESPAASQTLHSHCRLPQRAPRMVTTRLPISLLLTSAARRSSSLRYVFPKPHWWLLCSDTRLVYHATFSAG